MPAPPDHVDPDAHGLPGRRAGVLPGGALPGPALEHLIGQLRALDMDDVRRQMAEHDHDHASATTTTTTTAGHHHHDDAGGARARRGR